MYSTIDDKGIINNYANEPEVYYAAYPSPEKQRSYLYQGALATLLFTALIFTTFAIS